MLGFCPTFVLVHHFARNHHRQARQIVNEHLLHNNNVCDIPDQIVAEALRNGIELLHSIFFQKGQKYFAAVVGDFKSCFHVYDCVKSSDFGIRFITSIAICGVGLAIFRSLVSIHAPSTVMVASSSSLSFFSSWISVQREASGLIFPTFVLMKTLVFCLISFRKSHSSRNNIGPKPSCCMILIVIPNCSKISTLCCAP